MVRELKTALGLESSSSREPATLKYQCDGGLAVRSSESGSLSRHGEEAFPCLISLSQSTCVARPGCKHIASFPVLLHTNNFPLPHSLMLLTVEYFASEDSHELGMR